MNIFVLDSNPVVAAEYHCDKHVVKMILESSQMLANAFNIDELIKAPKTTTGSARKHSYLHHPCSKWVLDSYQNYSWLINLLNGLLYQYEIRYNKKHSIETFFRWIVRNIDIVKNRLEHKGITPFAMAMPDKYKTNSIVESYRKYYIGEKSRFAKWKNRIPYWWNN